MSSICGVHCGSGPSSKVSAIFFDVFAPLAWFTRPVLRMTHCEGYLVNVSPVIRPDLAVVIVRVPSVGAWTTSSTSPSPMKVVPNSLP